MLGIALLSLLSVAAKEHTVVFTAAQGDPDGKVTICEINEFSVNNSIIQKDLKGFIELKVAAKGTSNMSDGHLMLTYGTSASKITISTLKEEAQIIGIRLTMRKDDNGNLEVKNSSRITPQGKTWTELNTDWDYHSIDNVDPKENIFSVKRSKLVNIREIEVTYDDGILVPTYKVNVGDAPNATVTVNGEAPENVEIEEGQEANIQVKADEGYVITSVSVNGDKYLI